MERNEYIIDVIDRRKEAFSDETQSFSYLLACIICLSLALFFSLGIVVRNGDKPVLQLQTRINPNEATAASLVRLPQIGLTRAEKIIAYRQDNAGYEPVFTCSEDLQKVKGIGPVIEAGLSEYLRFEKENKEIQINTN